MQTQQQEKIVWPADTMPLLSIFRHPRLSILFTLKFKPLSYFIQVGILGTFASSLIGLIGSKISNDFDLGNLVVSSLLTSVLLYFITTAIISGLTLVIGAAFGGKGKFKPLFRALSLSIAPFIWTLPIILFWIQLSPKTFIYLNLTNLQNLDLFFCILGPLLIVIASIWTFILSLQAIALIHHFSKWKSFFVLILSSVISSIVLFFTQLIIGF